MVVVRLDDIINVRHLSHKYQLAPSSFPLLANHSPDSRNDFCGCLEGDADAQHCSSKSWKGPQRAFSPITDFTDEETKALRGKTFKELTLGPILLRAHPS